MIGIFGILLESENVPLVTFRFVFELDLVELSLGLGLGEFCFEFVDFIEKVVVGLMVLLGCRRRTGFGCPGSLSDWIHILLYYILIY